MEQPYVVAEVVKGDGVLTPRQQEVLVLMAEGLSAEEPGERLGASYRTVEVHRRRIYKRLGANNAPHAVSIAIAREILVIRVKSADSSD